MSLPSNAIFLAHARIKTHIHHTPLLSSTTLNAALGHDIVFKAEGFQKIGAFKARGAMNTLLKLKEEGRLPQRVCAFSSGNHAQAVAWAAQILGIKAHIFIPKTASQTKIQATRSYGAKVTLSENRKSAEFDANALVSESVYIIPPYDHDDVIAGQGTACFEALQDGVNPDAVFAPCGGGGLLSGTLMAVKEFGSQAQVFGAEPLKANDAAMSLRAGKIIGFDTAPDTIADGARTLAISARTFAYLQQLSGFFEVTENDIMYWTQWLTHLLKVSVEPTSAVAMAGAVHYLKTQTTRKRVLIILSGGNIGPDTQRQVWAQDYLTKGLVFGRQGGEA